MSDKTKKMDPKGGFQDDGAAISRLADIARKTVAKATWRDQLKHLDSDYQEERESIVQGRDLGELDAEEVRRLNRLVKDEIGNLLEVAKVLKDADEYPDSASFFLKSCRIEKEVKRRIEVSTIRGNLKEISERLEELHSSADESRCDPAEPSREGEDLAERLETECDRIFLEIMREQGEKEMADLFIRDRRTFEILRETGRQLLLGPSSQDDSDS